MIKLNSPKLPIETDHPLSPHRMDFVRFMHPILKKQLKKGAKLLDVGSGKNFLLYLIQEQKNISYTGIDIHPNKPKIKLSFKPEITEADINTILISRKFDLACCLWVLEHIKNDQESLNKINKLLRQKGLLILSVPSIFTWPYEFGRHGYHYYSEKKILTMVNQSGFRLVKLHKSGGLFGFVFMILYSWPRYVPLLIMYPFYMFLWRTKFVNSNWADFSTKFVSGTFYRYHRFAKGIAIHNNIVEFIVKFDKFVKIIPSAYVLILEKK